MFKFLAALCLFVLVLAFAGPFGILILLVLLAVFAFGAWLTGDLMKIGRDWASLIREIKEGRS